MAVGEAGGGGRVREYERRCGGNDNRHTWRARRKAALCHGRTGAAGLATAASGPVRVHVRGFPAYLWPWNMFYLGVANDLARSVTKVTASVPGDVPEIGGVWVEHR